MIYFVAPSKMQMLCQQNLLLLQYIIFLIIQKKQIHLFISFFCLVIQFIYFSQNTIKKNQLIEYQKQLRGEKRSKKKFKIGTVQSIINSLINTQRKQMKQQLINQLIKKARKKFIYYYINNLNKQKSRYIKKSQFFLNTNNQIQQSYKFT
ncbi:transmembrane protein, putative (macronuclear) [Tetrahymena thermophila SB210]|uniref:Transmembrane protein, putative n=1 Tax=Tetrahymena thermophila (strain SB210) TaxID=312017 RepID=W7XJR5_TETTS|nr:transmembrane protein, putative [Tetrahymena thermophila SB210]EWS75856.1 transmembrane protein, putative [Tetrahymena thermophila SB210]|eukprot:XP_012651612.1 transmembrane protein, putative [Tetrahymena thermophila SB210]